MNKTLITTLAGIASGFIMGYSLATAISNKKWSKICEDRENDIIKQYQELENSEEKDTSIVQKMIDEKTQASKKTSAVLADISKVTVNTSNEAKQYDYSKIKVSKIPGEENPEESHLQEDEVVDEDGNIDLPDDTEQKEANENYKMNHKRFEVFKEEEWEQPNMREVDYDQVELIFFSHDGVLCEVDGEGEELDEHKYCGDLLNQYHFKTDDSECIYIRNNARNCDYRIMKETSKDEFFVN